MEGQINKDIKRIVYNVLYKHRTKKGCEKYQDTYERSPIINDATIIKYTRFHAFNYRTHSYFGYIWNGYIWNYRTRHKTNYKLPKNYYN